MSYKCKNIEYISLIVLQSMNVRCAAYLCTLDQIFTIAYELHWVRKCCCTLYYIGNLMWNRNVLDNYVIYTLASLLICFERVSQSYFVPLYPAPASDQRQSRNAMIDKCRTRSWSICKTCPFYRIKSLLLHVTIAYIFSFDATALIC